MALIRTFITRGKRALTTDEMKPGFIYAVHYTLDADTAAQMNVTQEQWGIVMLDHNKQVRRSWNVTSMGVWSTDEVNLMEYKVYRSTLMEQSFAHVAESEAAYAIKMQKMIAREAQLDKKVRYYENNFWHRIAKRLDTFFSA